MKYTDLVDKELWIEPQKERNNLAGINPPERVHRHSWCHGYQTGLYEVLRYASFWYILKHSILARLGKYDR